MSVTMLGQTKPSQIRLVRWLTRIFGLSTTLYFLYTLLQILPSNPQVLPLTLSFVASSFSILVAWRLERWGGIATVICAVFIALSGMYGTYIYEQPNSLALGLLVLLAGVMWSFPQLAVGWLFIKIGQAAELAR